jgi:hypothetical protein
MPKEKAHVAIIMNMNRKEVARFIFMQAQVVEDSFYFILNIAPSRGM